MDDVKREWFFRSEPYDNCLYAYFELDSLVKNFLAEADDAKYQWLLSAWTDGWQHGEGISRAHESGDGRRKPMATQYARKK